MQARILFALLALMLVFQLGAARHFRVHDSEEPSRTERQWKAGKYTYSW